MCYTSIMNCNFNIVHLCIWSCFQKNKRKRVFICYFLTPRQWMLSSLSKKSSNLSTLQKNFSWQVDIIDGSLHRHLTFVVKYIFLLFLSNKRKVIFLLRWEIFVLLDTNVECNNSNLEFEQSTILETVTF